MAGSKKDIAKQFELPERQSKIASILKESEVYCICRSTDATSFMIACDNCEEWFHGHCVNINEVQSRQVKHYYCAQCRRENPGLKIEYKKPKGTPAPPKEKEHHVSTQQKDKEIVKQDQHGSTTQAKSGTGTKKGPGRPWKTAEKKSDPDDDTYQPQSRRLTQRNEVVEPAIPLPPSRSTRRGRPLKDESGFGLELKGLRQCNQPKCRKAARPNSKYCSDECGLLLASSRLALIMPPRVQEWSVKSVAEEHNDRDLTEIKRKYDVTFQMIKDLQSKRDRLDEHIAKVERLKFDPEYEEEETEEEGTVCCVSCGRDVPSRDAIKHMEKCYHKYESQMSFGSKFGTNVEGTPIFCDFFNTQSKTYCKRLRVLCNEHTKEPKISDTAICGCPADNEVKVGGRFCRNLKKTCSKHFSWEKLRRGEIDQERVRQLMKIDDLLEQERVVLQSKQDRGGVMGLLLNSTYDHDLDAKMAAAVAEHQRQQQEYDEEVRRREERARLMRREQEKMARLRYEQEMKRRREYEIEMEFKREEMKMRQQMADAQKAMDAESKSKPPSTTKSVSRQLVAAAADKSKAIYSSSSGSESSSSGSGSSRSTASSSGSEEDKDEKMEVDDEEGDDGVEDDSFVHLPSKREKVRARQAAADRNDGSELTASRLNKKK